CVNRIETVIEAAHPSVQVPFVKPQARATWEKRIARGCGYSGAVSVEGWAFAHRMDCNHHMPFGGLEPAPCNQVPSLDVTRNRPELRRLVWQRDFHFIDIAPAPAFRRVIAFDDRVRSGVEMRGGVPVRRIVAAADVAATAAQAQ